MAEEQKKIPFWDQVATFPANFWVACSMELLERLAFFGSRAVAPLFLIKTAGENGLGLSYSQKGWIYGIWALIQCLVPMVSGGYTDRYGYRLSLAIAFCINIMGYLLMGFSRPIAQHFIAGGWDGAGFWVFLMAACLVGLGTAIFKPPAQATIAKTTTEETSSVGWGFFYEVVNIGGAIAPMGAAYLRGEIDWNLVFFACAIVTAVNFLPALLLYKEPKKEQRAKEGGDGKAREGEKGVFGTFISSVVTIFGDLRLVVFLGIFSCFWLMFMQLWDLLPNFIDEWVDTTDVAGIFGWFSQSWVLESGQVKPEMVITIDALSIILLVIPISALISRMHKVAAMIIGMVISLIGFVAAGSTGIGWFCCAMVFVFSVGEMVCSPTFSAYVGLIAPKDKKALYMGYSNIPFAFGWFLGNMVGGYLYESVASKFKFAREYLVEHLGMSPDVAQNSALLPNERVMETMARLIEGRDVGTLQGSILHSVEEPLRQTLTGPGQEAYLEQLRELASSLQGAAQPELLQRVQQTLQAPSESALIQALQNGVLDVSYAGMTKDDYVAQVLERLDSVLGTVEPSAVHEATRMLWDLHHPYIVWYYLGAMGLLGTLGMILFYFFTSKVRRVAEPATA